MDKFLTFVTEQSEDIAAKKEKVALDIEKSFKKHFPKGWIISDVVKIIGDPVIHVKIGVIGNERELTSGYRENDPMRHTWIIRYSPVKDKFVSEISQQGISINPPEGSYLAMDRVKTGWRKKTADADKTISTFDTFFKKLKGLVKKHEKNIYQRSKYSDKWFK